jgi:hypothetical protein
VPELGIRYSILILAGNANSPSAKVHSPGSDKGHL